MTAADSEPTGRSSLWRTGLFVLSVFVVLTAGLLVPMPLAETAPGGVTDVAALLEVEGEPGEVDGSLGLLAVRVDQPSLLEVVRAAIDDERDLRRRDAVIPDTLDQRTYVELQQQEFRRSFRVAAAVGLDAAGYDVGIDTAVQVAGVLPDGPADGVLRLGDVVRTFEGTAVTSIDQLIGLVQRVSAGDRLELAVERNGVPTEVTVTAGRVPGLEHPAMGVTLQTLEVDLDLPVDVDLVDQRGIGGPSAGLMVALTTYDLVADEDLARGRSIVGTGTIAGDGTVGRIGSVREKAFTAVAAGADVMLVPASQAAEARDAAAGRVDVVGVATLSDAIEALRG